MKKISIIIPAYNAQNHIVNCINSIANEKNDYFNLEVIIVDDGSTDDTKKVCYDFINKDKSNIEWKFFSTENKGVSSARNYGLEKCSGEIIIFIDSDDKFVPKWIEKINNELIDSDWDVLFFSNYNGQFDNGIILNNNESLELFLEQKTNRVHNKIFKKSIIEKYNLKFNDKLNVAEDLLFLLEYLNKSEKVKLSNDTIYYYYLNENGAIRKPKIKYFKDYDIVYDKIKKIVVERKMNKNLIRDSNMIFLTNFLGIATKLFKNGMKKKQIIDYKNTIIFKEAKKMKKGFKNSVIYYCLKFKFFKFSAFCGKIRRLKNETKNI